MKPKQHIPLLILITICFMNLHAQVVSFDSDRWEFKAKELLKENFKGKDCILLKGGKAILKDTEFTNGIIEFDVAVPDERGFIGVFWRMQDEENYEKFYIRPHQSGNPDANQYTPVFNGVDGWQLYHGKEYSKAMVYKFDEWIHVKILLKDLRGEIYIDDMENPAIIIRDMKMGARPGRIGLIVDDYAPGRFAGFNYEALSSPPLKSRMQSKLPPPMGTILNWEVSDPFPESMIKGKTELGKNDWKEFKGLEWNEFTCEYNGLANLSRTADIRSGNTVFARIRIDAEVSQIKAFNFGFSDRIYVFLNNKLIYKGNNSFRTRDYRFLGTIGLFDTLFLPLEKGENVLLIAVAEDFGGWGLIGKFPGKNEE